MAEKTEFFIGIIRAKRPRGYLEGWYCVDLKLRVDRNAVQKRLDGFPDATYLKKIVPVEIEIQDQV